MPSLLTPPFVLLDDSKSKSRDNAGLLFQNPLKIIKCTKIQNIHDALERVLEAQNNGYYVAGWISYECGVAMHPTLDQKSYPISKEPLIWMGVFGAPKVLSSNDMDEIFHPHTQGISRPENCLKTAVTETKAEFGKAFTKIMDYIEAGDIYQVNHTFRLGLNFKGLVISLYAMIRKSQPVPFGAFIETGRWTVLSASPELFIKRCGNKLISRPMKGTAKSGKTMAEVIENSKRLKGDKKNRAENLMITDLIRNDFSRVCKPGSVNVNKLFEVERFSKVLQMSSEIYGTLKPKSSFLDIFECLFPCGSITGAPKIRAMEIIRETEKTPRGLYTGALGYLAPNKDFTFSVPIRTIVMDKTGAGHLAIGSGIVANSSRANEYQECLLKSRFLENPSDEFALIETFLWTPKKGYQYLPAHLKRLKDSARYFEFKWPIEELNQHLNEFQQTLNLNGPYKTRLTLAKNGTFTLQAKRAPSRANNKTLSIALASETVDKNDAFLFHKTTRRHFYEANLQAARESYEEKLYDLVFLNQDGEVTEGTYNSIFIGDENKQLETPPLKAGLLPGILRSKLLESGKAKETSLTIDDLKSANNIFLGNSVRGLIKAKLLV